jgi:hypothetical protein
LGAARQAFIDMSKPDADARIRFEDDANIIVILMTDEPDQTSGNIGDFVNFFGGPSPANARRAVIPVHAVCEGRRCDSRIQAVVNATGGVSGDIRREKAISSVVQTAVEREVGQQSAILHNPFIGASLRVALEKPVGTCNAANVPRSRLNGFDYDGTHQTISFFGTCRPAVGSEVAVSYRAWEAWTPD